MSARCRQRANGKREVRKCGGRPRELAAGRAPTVQMQTGHRPLLIQVKHIIEGGSAMVYEAIVQSKSLKRICERGSTI